MPTQPTSQPNSAAKAAALDVAKEIAEIITYSIYRHVAMTKDNRAWLANDIVSRVNAVLATAPTAPSEGLRSALLRVTGSLGLISKGANPNAVGHQENLAFARKVIAETAGQDRDDAPTPTEAATPDDEKRVSLHELTLRLAACEAERDQWMMRAGYVRDENDSLRQQLAYANAAREQAEKLYCEELDKNLTAEEERDTLRTQLAEMEKERDEAKKAAHEYSEAAGRYMQEGNKRTKELAELQRQAAELREDKARMDWITEKATWHDPHRKMKILFPMETVRFTTVRAAIDAARTTPAATA